MTVSTRKRFEVFKRDRFTCSYCGATPPAIVLEVDHITPHSKHGSDDINNLVTSCFGCNRGKSNIQLSTIPPTLQDNLSAMKEKETQVREYRKYIKTIERRINKDIEDVEKVLQEMHPDSEFTVKFRQVSIRKFLSLLPKHEIIDALRSAMSRLGHRSLDQQLTYFCGICWNIIKSNTSPVSKGSAT